MFEVQEAFKLHGGKIFPVSVACQCDCFNYPENVTFFTGFHVAFFELVTLMTFSLNYYFNTT